MAVKVTGQQADVVRAQLVKSRRPLYLDCKSAVAVGLEGCSLSIRISGRAETLLPMRHVSRVMANSRCTFSTDVLLACADRGISILLVNDDGSVRCRLLGTVGERQELVQRFVDFLSIPNWRERYQDWLESQTRIAALRLQHRLGLADAPVSPRAITRALDTVAASYTGTLDEARRSRLLINENLFAWMLCRLQSAGLDGTMELGHDGSPDLVEDLYEVFAWYSAAPWIGWLHRRARWAERNKAVLGRVERSDMIRLYQRHAARLERFGDEIVNNFHRWLVEQA